MIHALAVQGKSIKSVAGHRQGGQVERWKGGKLERWKGGKVESRGHSGKRGVLTW